MYIRALHILFFLGLMSLCGLSETRGMEEPSPATTENAAVPDYVPFSFFSRSLEEELETDRLPQSSSEPSVAVSSNEEGEKTDQTASTLRPGYQKTQQKPQQNSEDSSPPFEPISQQVVTPTKQLTNNAHTCDGLTCGASCGSGQLRHLGVIKRSRGYCDACGLTTCSHKMYNRWFVDGWVSFGSTLNFDWPKDKDNSPLRYNDRNADVVMNQLYLSAGRKINKRRGKFDFGGQIDFLYGTDYFATSSLNLETRDVRPNGLLTLNPYEAALHWNSNKGPRHVGTGEAALYGFSLPQAYAEVFVPFRFGTTVKAGHFYSGMGLESAMSPQNFFYSHSYSFMYGSPTTLTGITTTTQWTKRLSTVYGITQGWNVFDNPMDRINYLAGVQWETLDKETALSFIVHTGKESNYFGSSDIRTGYTLTLNQLLTRRLRYSLEHTLGFEDNAYRAAITPSGQARWISVAQYLQWELNDQWAFGLRGEWFRDDGYSRIVNQPETHGPFSVSGKDLFEVTLGVNWKPTRFITVRPELRYDWANTRVRGGGETTGIFGDHREMFSFAIDAVVRF